jgi:hypothetical protein
MRIEDGEENLYQLPHGRHKNVGMWCRRTAALAALSGRSVGAARDDRSVALLALMEADQ